MYRLCIADRNASASHEEHPKSAYRVSLRPNCQGLLSFIAERDGRSMANMLEWLIRRHCEAEGLGWPPQGCEITVAKPQPVCPVTPKQEGVHAREKGKSAE